MPKFPKRFTKDYLTKPEWMEVMRRGMAKEVQEASVHLARFIPPPAKPLKASARRRRR